MISHDWESHGNLVTSRVHSVANEPPIRVKQLIITGQFSAWPASLSWTVSCLRSRPQFCVAILDNHSLDRNMTQFNTKEQAMLLLVLCYTIGLSQDDPGRVAWPDVV